MKMDISDKIYKDVFKQNNNVIGLNKIIKGIVYTTKDGKEIIIKNDNFGTRRKYLDFTNGRKEANIHPLQIIVSDVDFLLDDTYFVDSNDKKRKLNELKKYVYRYEFLIRTYFFNSNNKLTKVCTTKESTLTQRDIREHKEKFILANGEYWYSKVFLVDKLKRKVTQL